MFVSTCKGGVKRQYTYVRLMESYRDENGKVKHRVIQTLGRLDILSKEDPDYLEKLKQKYRDDYEEKSRLQSLNRIEQARTILDFDNDSSVSSPLPLLQYGHYALKRIWDDLLHLDRKFKDIQKKQTEAKFDLNALVSHLCFLKILDPYSIVYTFGDLDGFLGAPVQGIDPGSYHDSCGYLSRHKDSIMRFFNRAVNKQLGKTKSSLVYCDVTNVCFEPVPTDQDCERRQADFQKKLEEQPGQAWKDGEPDDGCPDGNGGLKKRDKSMRFSEKTEEQTFEYLRIRDSSREHRLDLPSASIALVINEHGIPIDFHVYDGNASGFKAMAASIDSLKRKHGVGESIVVANGSLNSASNLRMLLDNKLGFLAAQKVTELDRPTTQTMLDPQGYVPLIRNGREVAHGKVVRNWVKKGSTKEEDTECTLVLTFDRLREKRDLAVLELRRELALKKQSIGVKAKPENSDMAPIAGTDEKTEAMTAGIDEDAFERKKRLAGYAALVYGNSPDCAGEDCVPASRLAAAYHELNQIRECFGIMTSRIGLRPTCTGNSNHITGQLLICVLALGILKLLQWKLGQEGNSLTAEEIIRALNSAMTVPIKGSEDVMFLQCARPDNFGKGREPPGREKLGEVMRQEQSEPSRIEVIFKAVGLIPPARLVSLKEMGRCLGVRFGSSEEAIPGIAPDKP